MVRTKFYTEHKKTQCDLCGNFFDVANIKKHRDSCGKSKKENIYHVTHDGLNCIFCGKLCKHKNSLAQHEIRCKNNPEAKNRGLLASYIKNEIAALNADGKVLTKETSTRVAKAAATLGQRYQSGEIVSAMRGKPSTFLGKKHSEESKAKTRISTLAYLENTLGSIQARYNVNACRYIDFLNGRFNWHLQHAENGGEVRICGYFLDGYDKELNIVFEYDEPTHYTDVYKNILCERDINPKKSFL